MKFNFKVQDYQTKAVESVVNVFKGQSFNDKSKYIRDSGKYDKEYDLIEIDKFGYSNEIIHLSQQQLFENIKNIQNKNEIEISDKLFTNLGACNLDVEMETGTGKTYVYIKTIFELNAKYGWSKFIIVVPSVAIREGIKKSFEITVDHFMEYYNKKARFFVYDSSKLNQIDNFSKSNDINVMIVNTQAFNTSLKENGKSKESRIIYSKQEKFGYRKPIDVIKENRPILILDEPQKMGGEKTQQALKNFNPLFTINYSATHKEKHNLVYVLDTIDAYKEKLVKKIEVRGFELKNLRGTSCYLYLDKILVYPNKNPKAKIELEIKYNKSINRETRILDIGDSLYSTSNELEQYKNIVISDINALENVVRFTNGEELYVGQMNGDTNDEHIRKLQIKSTIEAHFAKEEELFYMGIKTLSLFFIDEVSNYRIYDENNNELLGKYGKIFEEEYKLALDEAIKNAQGEYKTYLENYCSDISKVHNGYFSIDKNGRSINSALKRKETFSDDITAYELILKNKERLLSFEEPTRFIFSHSALREGWDNPNVFQICTLKHSDSEISKRQEVGRGLRLCVNKDGNRIDKSVVGEDEVHNINLLTVIASESYQSFVSDLQDDIKSSLYKRPTKANIEYFKNKFVEIDGKNIKINEDIANKINHYLIKNDYIDEDYNITQTYKNAITNGNIAEVSETLKPYENAIHKLMQVIYDNTIINNMISDASTSKVEKNPLNENFYKKEFEELWNNINNKYSYRVKFDSNELKQKAIKHIKEKLYITELIYTETIGVQNDNFNRDDIDEGKAFTSKTPKTNVLKTSISAGIKYDLIGKISIGTKLTRKTIVEILKGIGEEKLNMFKNNPEEFIKKCINLINEQKSTMIVEHITYNKLEEKFDSSIFTVEKNKDFSKAFTSQKAIQNYIFTDGYSDESVERKFVKSLEEAIEVKVFAKLPKGFYIPTPVGNYSPDWAIVFDEDKVKHIFFIVETKGSMSSLDLRAIEEAKISCAKKLFESMSCSNIKYHEVDSFETLMDIVVVK